MAISCQAEEQPYLYEEMNHKEALNTGLVAAQRSSFKGSDPVYCRFLRT